MGRPKKIIESKAVTLPETQKENLIIEMIETVERVCGLKPDEKVFMLRNEGVSVDTCVRVCNISKKLIYDWAWKYKKDPQRIQRLMNKIDMLPDFYRNQCKLRLGQISAIERAALQEYQLNPMLAVERPQLLKHLKQSAGVLQEEGFQALMINIGQIQAIIQTAFSGTGTELKGIRAETLPLCEQKYLADGDE